MLITHHSNRLEALGDALAEVLAIPRASPLAPEIIAVQNIGTARWLALLLARQLGVAANLEFPFPAALLWRLFCAALPNVPERSPFGTEVLTWRVLGELADGRSAPGVEALAEYLGDGDAQTRYALAQQIALRLDEYMVYRPDWILAWEAGQAEHWQARLWRRMTAGRAGRHRVRLAEEFVASLRSGALASVLPERLSLFGLTALPPAHLALFAELGRACDVHLFLLNPCQEYWGEIRGPREIVRRAGEADPAALRLETGNDLLASLGSQGRDLIDRLQDVEAAEEFRFEEPGEGCLLHAVQADILHLRNRGEGEEAPTPLRLDDRSIQVHACHGPAREVEVLHDQLLALLTTEPGLTPADILVIASDLDRYASLVEAVFGTAEAARRIPYQVAGRAPRRALPLVRAFFDLLALPEGRADPNAVLALLEVEAVRRRAGLDPADLETIRDWIRDAGIRWGIDAADREARGLPALPDHTWRVGLDRLLLGVALPGGDRCFAGLLPCGDAEGEEAAVLGRLAAFAETLFTAAADLRTARSVPAWADRLRRLVADVFDPAEDEEAEHARLLAAIARMAEHAEQAGFGEEVPLSVVRACLEGVLEADGGRAPLGAGTVTVCGLVPARAIPFAVVCLLGMDDGTFPRTQRPAGFDLMREAPRPGDRSRRQDDRALFLEALLAARKVFYVSYVGQHIRENTPLPPSAPVSELLDYLDRGFRHPEAGRAARDAVVTRHPLQPFSPRYFRPDGTLFSFSADLCTASRAAGAERAAPAPFLRAPLPEPPAEWRQVTLEQFLRFFAHPARYLARERLGIRLEEHEGLLEAREPFVLAPLASHQLREALVAGAQEGRPAAETQAAARGRGFLPHGAVGEVFLAREAARAETLAGRIAGWGSAAPCEPVAVGLDLGPLRLRGRLGELTARGRFVSRCGRTRAKDRLALWIGHLLLNALGPAGVAPESWFLAEDGALRLTAVPGAGAELRRLADCYWAGCRRALPLLPESSYAYAERRHAGKDREAALAAARKAWETTDWKRGEDSDPYNRLVFRAVDPLDEVFCELAEAAFLPLLAHQEAV